MAASLQTRKRKAVTHDSPARPEPAIVNGFGGGSLDDAFSASEDGFEEEDFDEVGSGNESYSEDDTSIDEELDVRNGQSKRNGRITQNGLTHEDEDVANYTITEDALGNRRYVYREIDPVYDSDDSEAPETSNTIGNIPLSFYDSYPHIGYDVDGRRIMRPARGAALDTLLDSIEIPKGWTGLTDPATGKPLELNEEELQVLKRLTRNEVEEGYDPYPDTVEYFTSKTEQMPLNAAPEPKRRFVPSKHEAVKVMKIVKAMREGRIQPYKPTTAEDEDAEAIPKYDLWSDEVPRPDHIMNVPAPKLPPPGYDESYHPPPEYVPDDEEKKKWEELEEEDREKDYLPTDYNALRRVPGYERFVKDKFERCLDLYLAPRIRRSKLDIDPESLLPKLPTPEELRPFPTKCDITLRGHKGRVRSVAIHPEGSHVATAGDDGTVRIWKLQDGRQVWVLRLRSDEAVNIVRWRPVADTVVLAATVAETVFLIAPDVDDSSFPVGPSRDLLNAGWQTTDSQNAAGKESPARWVRPELRLQERGVLIQINLRSSVKVLSWHRRGEYFSTVSPAGQSTAVAIHALSKHQTQLPFRKLKGLAQSVQFHPSKPIFFVATQRLIRSYDLSKQELVKIMQPGARWISSFDVHPGGDNLVVGSYDKRLLWMDMDLSTRPYKTLRYHSKAIRQVRFHQGGLPLFADASDDGTLQIFHGRVVNDLMENANIVPLKVLKGHEITNGLGVLDIDWHPSRALIISGGADGTCKVWVP